VIRRLAEKDDPSDFFCGNPALDRFLRVHALHNAETGVGVTYIIPAASGTVAGYVTLSGAVVEAAEIPDGCSVGSLPGYPLPAILVARLAVDARYRHGGLGSELLTFAFEEAVIAHQRVGCVGVAVDAKSEATRFYERHGFEPMTITPRSAGTRRLFLEIAAVINALG
jgi:GNAT superfamily N-acetyltransferase